MTYLRAFIAGIALPSVLLPIFLCIAVYNGKEALLQVSFIHYIPILWGIWNVLYFAIFKNILSGSEGSRLILTGAALGLLVAVIAVFGVGAPQIIGLTGGVEYLPLIIAPIVYGVLWWLVVKPLNKIVGIAES